MTPSFIISIVSLVVSLISTAIAVLSFRRTRHAQEYDYSARVQIDNEKIITGGPGKGDAFTYSADLVNVGVKPVEIDRVYVDYGGETLDTSWHFHVEGACHIPPSGKRQIKFRLSEEDYQAAMAKFELKECLLRLRVRYLSVSGGVVERERCLIAIGPDNTTFYAQRSDALT